jgi:hypothetical protein
MRTEVLSNWAVETLEDLPPAEASTQGLNCKTNTILILMHQMRISTNYIFSLVLRPKNMEIRNIMNTESKTNTLTILMHQMRISTTQVSSVMLWSKVGNPKKKKM